MKKLIALFAITGLIFTSCNNMQTNNPASGPSDEDRRTFREQIKTHNTFRKAFKEENIEDYTLEDFIVSDYTSAKKIVMAMRK